jgi:hypothetical protein
MFTLILFIVLALGYGYFATQNTALVSIVLPYLTIPDIPMYVIIGVTLLIGLTLSWLISLVDGLFATMALHGKDSTIKNAKRTNAELSRKINELEIENAKLMGKLENETTVIGH